MPKSREQSKPEKELGQKKESEGRAEKFLEDITSKVESGKISEEIMNMGIDKLNKYRNDIEITLQYPDNEISDELVDKSKRAKNALAKIEDKLRKALEG